MSSESTRELTRSRAGTRAGVSPTPRELAAMLFRHPRMLAGSFVVIFVSAILIVIFSARYESHFMVLLRRGRYDPVVSAQPASPMDFTRPEVTEEELNSEVELLRDPDLLKEVVVAAAMVPADIPEADRQSEIEHAARKLGRRLEVDALKKSNLIQVSYKDTSPERSARVLKELSRLYMQRHMNLQRPAGEIQFFDQQTAAYEDRLQRSEAELVDFTKTRGVASAALERDIALQKLGEANAAYRQVAQDLSEAQRRIGSLNEQVKTFPSRSVTLERWSDNPQALEKMKTHLLELQLKRTELLTKYEPSYRLVQEVEEEIKETKDSIAAEALSPVRDETTDKDPNYEWARMELEKAQVQRDGLRARQTEAATEVASLHAVADRLQADSVDQQDLIRAAKADEDNYLLYLHKREEARIGDALDDRQILNVAIVEPPVAPAIPVHSIFLYFLLCFAGASLFSLGLAFATEYLDPTIRTPDEAAGLLEVPVLAWLPASEQGILVPFHTAGAGRRSVEVQ